MISSENILFILFLSTARDRHLDGTIKTNLGYPFWFSMKRINKKLLLTVFPFLNTRSISFLFLILFFFGKAMQKN